MSEHLTSLELDELAADAPGAGEVKAHLEACAECRERLEALRAANVALLRRPEASRVLDRLRATQEATADRAQLTRQASGRPRTLWLVAASLAALAWFFIALPLGQSTDRVKGTPTIEVLDSTLRSIHHAAPGSRAVVALGGAGATYAAVFTVDEHGEVTRLWPVGAEVMAALPRGPRALLEPGFEVTPGSALLVGVFADQPLPLSPLQTELTAQAHASATPLKLSVSAPRGVRVAQVGLEVSL